MYYDSDKFVFITYTAFLLKTEWLIKNQILEY